MREEQEEQDLMKYMGYISFLFDFSLEIELAMPSVTIVLCTTKTSLEVVDRCIDRRRRLHIVDHQATKIDTFSPSLHNTLHVHRVQKNTYRSGQIFLGHAFCEETACFLTASTVLPSPKLIL